MLKIKGIIHAFVRLINRLWMTTKKGVAAETTPGVNEFFKIMKLVDYDLFGFAPLGFGNFY